MNLEAAANEAASILPGHRYVIITTSQRPWWKWFGNAYSFRCWKCDMNDLPLGGECE